MPFKKGHPYGKLGGRPRIPDEIKYALKYEKSRFNKIMHDVSALTRGQLKKLLQDDDTDLLTAWIASCFLKGIKEGNPFKLEVFNVRMMGTVPKNMNVGVGTIADFVKANQGDYASPYEEEGGDGRGIPPETSDGSDLQHQTRSGGDEPQSGQPSDN